MFLEMLKAYKVVKIEWSNKSSEQKRLDFSWYFALKPTCFFEGAGAVVLPLVAIMQLKISGATTTWMHYHKIITSTQNNHMHNAHIMSTVWGRSHGLSMIVHTVEYFMNIYSLFPAPKRSPAYWLCSGLLGCVSTSLWHFDESQKWYV